MTPGGGGGLWTRRLIRDRSSGPYDPRGGCAPTPPGGQRPPLRKGAPSRGPGQLLSARWADSPPRAPRARGAGGSGTRPYGRARREFHSSHLRTATWGRPYEGHGCAGGYYPPLHLGQPAWRVTTSACVGHSPNGAPGRGPGQLHPGPRAAAVRRSASNPPGDLLWGLRPHSP